MESAGLLSTAMWCTAYSGGNNIHEKSNLRKTNVIDSLDQVMLTENISKHDENISLLISNQIIQDKNLARSQLLTPPRSCEELNIPLGTVIPPDLPKLFLDLLVPIPGLKNKKLDYECGICGEEFGTMNSLRTHNKSHRRPACLSCGLVLSSHSRLLQHGTVCSSDPVVVTSKYGRSRPVKSYLAPTSFYQH